MGQHFLADAGAAREIVKRAQLNSDDFVVEIGAGLGALTLFLAPQVKHVLAVEPDRQVSAILASELQAAAIGNVTIIEEDILRCDLEEIAKRFGVSLKVIGNLPYHISSQVLIRLIRFRRVIDAAFLMFQKEVAERLLAEPGIKRYGRLSVLIQYCASVRPLLSVSASAFFPKPKVDSQVLRMAFLHPVPFQASSEELLFQVVGAAFGKRRKTLKNALSGSNLGLEHERVLGALQLAGIDPKRRAETLSVKEFVALSNAFLSVG
jgi:16S rRNA (adenine1518-N6/adenine1519-N6)-dimethyltransferase